ncbi:MAG: hypothetical protein ABJH04_07490 [Cyclobacteriaceae bacterium]
MPIYKGQTVRLIGSGVTAKVREVIPGKGKRSKPSYEVELRHSGSVMTFSSHFVAMKNNPVHYYFEQFKEEAKSQGCSLLLLGKQRNLPYLCAYAKTFPELRIKKKKLESHARVKIKWLMLAEISQEPSPNYIEPVAKPDPEWYIPIPPWKRPSADGNARKDPDRLPARLRNKR